MHVSVNGVRLFFDVEGAKFVPDGPVMRERPVLLMLRRFLQPEAPLDQEAREAWRRLAMPVYTRVPRDPDMARRAISRPEVALHWFAKPRGESDTFNMFPELDRIRCPTLVIGGEDDPMHPIESQADIAAALPPSLVQFERFADCGHGVVPDAPERAMALLREFILRR
jgi:proline iminopeptidase